MTVITSASTAGRGSDQRPPFIIGIHLDSVGSHPAAWRDEVIESPGQTVPDRLRTIAAALETAGFAYATFAGAHLPPSSGPARIDPLQQATFIGPLTTRIALIPEVPVTYVEPFHTATQLASLDLNSAGRGGWLVSAENSEAAARQFGRDELSASELSSELVDVVAVSRLLWDSWEDDAVIKDVATGRYIDPDKLHYTDFKGRSFSVKGPSIVPRPPQGQLPVLVPLQHADAGEEAVDADVIIVPAGPSLDADVERARALGADVVLADLEIVLDGRGERADDRLARLDADVPWTNGEVERFVGAPEALVELLSDLAHKVDGVRLIPSSIDRDLAELRYRVLPELFSEGVLSAYRPYPTAREIFGLPEAANVYAHPEGN